MLVGGVVFVRGVLAAGATVCAGQVGGTPTGRFRVQPPILVTGPSAFILEVPQDAPPDYCGF